MAYPASVSYLSRNANEIVHPAKSKWNEDVEWPYAGDTEGGARRGCARARGVAALFLLKLVLVGAIPGCIFAGVRRH
eukprot:1710225-Rhodomonas_salina.1